jgi:predicted metal-dependent HD superfamily phosphohydrolase
MDALRGRWSADCTRAVPDADEHVVDEVGTDLARRWREPHRRYHDETHLGEVLSAVDALCDAEHVRPEGRSAALLGAWFHDAVYAVGVPESNEERSAALAVESLGRVGATPELAVRVATLVLDTAAHDLGGRVRDPARVVLHDADLWVLAAPVGRFDEYCRQVRAEYSHVPPADYAVGRSRVLRPFLARPHVYRTRHARAEWEPAARENLARELTRLAG